MSSVVRIKTHLEGKRVSFFWFANVQAMGYSVFDTVMKWAVMQQKTHYFVYVVNRGFRFLEHAEQEIPNCYGVTIAVAVEKTIVKDVMRVYLRHRIVKAVTNGLEFDSTQL